MLKYQVVFDNYTLKFFICNYIKRYQSYFLLFLIFKMATMIIQLNIVEKTNIIIKINLNVSIIPQLVSI